jgi:hypothetical protein
MGKNRPVPGGRFTPHSICALYSERRIRHSFNAGESQPERKNSAKAADVGRKQRRFLAKWPGGDGICPSLAAKSRRGCLWRLLNSRPPVGKVQRGAEKTTFRQP